MKAWTILVLLGAFELCAAGRILLVLPVPSRSHYILHQYLVDKLAEKGHEITLVAPYKRSEPRPNVKEIIVPDTSDKLFTAFSTGNSDEGKFKMRNFNPLLFLSLGSVGKIFMDAVMNDPSVKKLLTSNQKFDLVVGEAFMMEALLAGLAYKLKAPLAMTSPSMPFSYVNELAGNPAPVSYIPEAALGYSDSMSFRERLINYLFSIFATGSFYMFYLPKQHFLLNEYFGSTPPIQDLISNTSVILVNHHFSLAFPRPYVPKMVEVGGFHVKPPKPLPKDIQKFIDDAKDGVIFFSMGSNLRSDEFPKEKFDGILKAFSQLKQRILWKFEKENPPDLPPNVKISKWLPQSDILAQPNVKLFITHGGLLSTTESIYRGVPLIGIPIFGDQPANVKLIEKIGVGIKLNYDDIEEKSLLKSVREVLNNPKYRENAKLRSQILRDRPLPPVDMAVYWLEYAMRYKGTPHLRSGALDLTWTQMHSMDVFGVVLFVLLVVLKSVELLFKKISGAFAAKKKKTSQKKKKN